MPRSNRNAMRCGCCSIKSGPTRRRSPTRPAHGRRGSRPALRITGWRPRNRPPKGSLASPARPKAVERERIKASDRFPAPATPASPPAIRGRSGTATACLWRGMPPSACGLVPTSGALQPYPCSSDRSRAKPERRGGLRGGINASWSDAVIYSAGNMGLRRAG